MKSEIKRKHRLLGVAGSWFDEEHINGGKTKNLEGNNLGVYPFFLSDLLCAKELGKGWR